MNVATMLRGQRGSLVGVAAACCLFLTACGPQNAEQIGADEVVNLDETEVLRCSWVLDLPVVTMDDLRKRPALAKYIDKKIEDEQAEPAPQDLAGRREMAERVRIAKLLRPKGETVGEVIVSIMDLMSDTRCTASDWARKTDRTRTCTLTGKEPGVGTEGLVQMSALGITVSADGKAVGPVEYSTDTVAYHGEKWVQGVTKIHAVSTITIALDPSLTGDEKVSEKFELMKAYTLRALSGELKEPIVAGEGEPNISPIIPPIIPPIKTTEPGD